MSRIKIIIISLGILILVGAGIVIYLERPATNKSNSTQPATAQSQFALPVVDYKTGQTKRHFGQYITPPEFTNSARKIYGISHGRGY